MAFTQFNGATVSYTDAGAVAIFADKPLTSFSISGGDRAEVDVTTSAARASLPGLVSPRRATIGMLFEDPTITELEGMIAACAAGTLTLKVKPCGGTAVNFVSDKAWLMSYDISAQVDGVFEVTMEFLFDETAA